jgi:hypothetical protein
MLTVAIPATPTFKNERRLNPSQYVRVRPAWIVNMAGLPGNEKRVTNFTAANAT